MDWKKYFCPVCGIDFTDEDDVVVCPECGTPHHRSCWQKTGKCINEQHHGTGDSLECTYKKAGEISDAPVAPSEEKENERYAYGNSEIKEEYDSEENKNEQNNQDWNKGANPFFNPEFQQKQNFYINGRPAVYYEIAVAKNQQYYIPRFMLFDKAEKPPVTWNFVAFLFPLAWALYRKIYKLAALIFAVYFAIFAVTVFSVSSNTELINSFNACYEEDAYFLTDITNYMNDESGSTLTPNQQKLYDQMMNFQVSPVFEWITIILSYGVRIAVALFGSKLYFKKINKTISNGEKLNYTENKLKDYIYRKNGVLPMFVAVIIGIIEYNLF